MPLQEFSPYEQGLMQAQSQAAMFGGLESEQKCGKCGLARHSNVIYCPPANAQCLFCGKMGHYRRCCRLARFEWHASTKITRDLRRSIVATNVDHQSRQYVVMRVKNRSLQLLVDSGSSSSLISKKMALGLGLKLEQTPNLTNSKFNSSDSSLRTATQCVRESRYDFLH